FFFFFSSFVYLLFSLVFGLGYVVICQCSVVSGQWFVDCGLWFVVCGQRRGYLYIRVDRGVAMVRLLP
ncbi:MAG: hypothetical protein OXO50_19890, partial [Caldilineaceae bacterium]|nr:hypothetical protein [Caldilineaceae bacterium]